MTKHNNAVQALKHRGILKNVHEKSVAVAWKSYINFNWKG
jgi:hypothetical protein